MQKIYSTENRVALYLLKAKLEEKNIQCLIKNEAPAGPAAGEIPPVMAYPELWIIDDQYYSEASAILQKELSTLSLAKKSWQCPQCKEVLEGQFNVCWKCGYSQPE